MALSEAIIATYMTIHMARSPGSHSGRIASPCQEFPGGERKSCGCGFQATKARVRFARAPSGAPGARHDRDRTHSQAPSQAWPGAKAEEVGLGVRSALLGQRYARLELK